MNFQFNSVKTKFLVFLIPLFVISFAVISLISYNLTSKALMESTESNLSSISEKSASEIYRTMDKRMTRLKELSEQPVFASGDTAAITAELQKVKTRFDNFDLVAYCAVNGDAVDWNAQQIKRGDRAYIKAVIATKKH